MFQVQTSETQEAQTTTSGPKLPGLLGPIHRFATLSTLETPVEELETEQARNTIIKRWPALAGSLPHGKP